MKREPTLERLAIAQSLMLDPFGLSEASLARALATIREHRVDDADLYFQTTRHEGLEPGGGHRQERQLQHRPGRGRARGGRREDRLRLLRRPVGSRADGRGAHGAHDRRRRPAAPRQGAPARRAQGARASRVLYAPTDPIGTLDSAQKVALLERVEKLARAKDPRIVQVMASVAAEHDVVLVARADGTRAADVRPLVRVSVTVIAEQDGRREVGSGGGGGRFGLGYFQDAVIAGYVDQAVNAALTNLESRPGAGRRDDRGAGPGLARRAAARGGGPRPGGRLQPQGQQHLRRPHRPARGGQGRDGARRRHHRRPPRQRSTSTTKAWPAAQRADRGRHPARLHPGQPERPPDGREAHRQRPPRELRPCADAAHDQHLHAGRQQDPAEIVASIKRGLYATNFGGGQVDITSGKFVFSASEAFWVENGKIQYPVKGATHHRQRPGGDDRVSMIGNDLQLDTGVGVCGKEGQSVPVGVGQPTLRIERLTVGGTA
jgi:TldD protein